MHHKCPKDEENIGKPRRGRRPKAYDELVPTNTLLRTGSVDETHIPVVATAATVSSSTVPFAAAATSSSFYHHIPSVPQPAPPPVAHLGGGLSLESGPSKSRRKPRQTIRILTPQHREMFLTDHDAIQTQPLNLSLSPSLQGPTTLSVIVPHRNYATHSSPDILDLSRSRSDDSEAEAIEEEVDDEEDDDMYDSDHYHRRHNSSSDNNGNGGMDVDTDHEETNGKDNGNGAIPLTKPKTTC